MSFEGLSFLFVFWIDALYDCAFVMLDICPPAAVPWKSRGAYSQQTGQNSEFAIYR